MRVSHGASGQGDRSKTEVVGSEWEFTAGVQHGAECHLCKFLLDIISDGTATLAILFFPS